MNEQALRALSDACRAQHRGHRDGAQYGDMLKWMAARYNGDVIPPEPDLDAVRRDVQEALARIDNCYDELDAANVALTRALGMLGD